MKRLVYDEVWWDINSFATRTEVVDRQPRWFLH
jgi:hypothetical protein